MASLKSKILGHDHLIALWTQLLQTGKLTGSFLFVGPSGVGKVKSAWAFMQEALCENPAKAPCGDCGSCRRVEQRNHESIRFIQADGPQIKADQAQSVLEFLQLQSIRSHRFILIEDAQKLNATAANSLLKTLEEPPEGTTFILTAPSISSVLPTIRSRCRVFHFQPISHEIMLDNKVASDWQIYASQGRFDKLMSLSDADTKEMRLKWAEFLVQLLTSADTLSEETWREKIKNRDEIRQAVEIWLGLVRDALFFQQGEKKSLLNLDMNAILVKLAQIPTPKLHALSEGLIQFQKELSFNKDAVLSLESLYIHHQR